MAIGALFPVEAVLMGLELLLVDELSAVNAADLGVLPGGSVVCSMSFLAFFADLFQSVKKALEETKTSDLGDTISLFGSRDPRFELLSLDL